MPPGTANDFVRALQKAWRAGDRLSGDTSDLVTMIKTLSGITFDPGLSPRGTWSTDSGSVLTRKTQSNLVAAAIRTTAISTATAAVTTLAQPRVSSAQITTTTSDSDIITVTHPALDGAQIVSNASPPQTGMTSLTSGARSMRQ